MIDYCTWLEDRQIKAVICFLLMCHLKLWLLKLTLHNDYRYIQIISCLLFLWRVKFLANFAFSSQWLHMRCFDRRSCRHFSDSICFFILRFHYNVCLQWLHLYYFFIIELKLVNRNLKTIYFLLFFKQCLFSYFWPFFYMFIFNMFH